MTGNVFLHSHSLPFPDGQFPFIPINIPNFVTNFHSHGIPTGLFLFLPIPIPKQSFNRCDINIFGISKTRLTYNIIVLSLSLNLTVSIKLASDVPEAHHEQAHHESEDLFNAKWLQHLGDNICANAFYYFLFSDPLKNVVSLSSQ